MKATKVLWNDVRLKDIYVGASWFEVLKYKTMRLIRNAFIFLIRLLIISASLVMLFLIARHYFPKIQIVEKEVISDTLEIKVAQMKAEILRDIKQGESHNAPESAGIIIFDVNHKASIGSYQFQITTVQHYYKVLYHKTITQKEAILIALDDTLAGQLASDILFTQKGGYNNWYNTSKKYNISDRLELLASLTK